MTYRRGATVNPQDRHFQLAAHRSTADRGQEE